MSRRIQIANLRNARIASEVRGALRGELDVDRIADFLANVDWSGADKAAAAVRERLGLLESWATEYAEGEMSRDEYVDRLRVLLREQERNPDRKVPFTAAS